MNKTIEQPEKGVSRINIHLTADDLQADLDRELKKLRKNLQLPGFRKGKVPMSLIRKKYEEGLLAEILNKKINEILQENDEAHKGKRFSEYIEYGEPELDFENKNFSFSFDWLSDPEVTVDQKVLDEIPVYAPEITDDFLTKEINTGRYSFPHIKEAEAVGKDTDEILFLYFENEDKPVEIYYFLPVKERMENKSKSKAYLKLFEGKKKGDKVSTDLKTLKKILPEYVHLEKWLEGKDLKNTAPVEVEIQSVFDVTPLTEEEYLKETAIPKDEEQEKEYTLEELREKFKAVQEDMYQKRAKALHKNMIKDQLEEILQTSLPDDFMIRLYKAQTGDEEKARQFYEDNRKRLEYLIGRDKTLQDEGAEVSGEEIFAVAYNEVVNWLLQQNNMNTAALPDEETLAKITLDLLENDKTFAETVASMAKDNKLLDVLSGKSGREPEVIPAEEFNRIYNDYFSAPAEPVEEEAGAGEETA